MDSIIIGKLHRDGNTYSNLWSIANEYGYESPDVIYNFEANKLIRGEAEAYEKSIHGKIYENRNMNTLYPGDVVYLPPKEEIVTYKGQLFTVFKDMDAETKDVARSHETFQVRIVYADDPDTGPDGQNQVIYWLYDKEEQGLDTMVNWVNAQCLLPQGIAYTSNGHILPNTKAPKIAFENMILGENHSFSYSTTQKRYTYKFDEIEVARDHFEVENKLRRNSQGVLSYKSSYYKNIYTNTNEEYYNWANEQLRIMSDEEKEQSLLKYYNRYPRFIYPGQPFGNIWDLRDITVRRDSSVYATSGDYANCKVPPFMENRTYGFLLLPPSMGPFKTRRLTELAETPVFEYDDNNAPQPIDDRFVATKIKMDPTLIEDGVIKVPVHCTLSEWDQRLRKQLADLKRELKKTDEIVQGHCYQIGILTNMENLLNGYKKFPHDPIPSEDMDDIDAFSTDMQRLREGISENFMTDLRENQNWENIEKEGRKLLELLNKKELHDEIKRYNDHWLDEINKAGEGKFPTFRTGPYTTFEPNWDQIFETIINCMEVLQKTLLIDEFVADEQLEMILDGFCTIGGPVEPDFEELYEKHGSQLNGFIKPEVLQSPGLFGAILFCMETIKGFNSKVSPFLYETAGPDSVLIRLVNCIGPKFVEKLVGETTATIQSSKTFGFFRGFVKIVGIRRGLTENEGVKLSKLLLDSAKTPRLTPEMSRKIEDLEALYNSRRKGWVKAGKELKKLRPKYEQRANRKEFWDILFDEEYTSKASRFARKTFRGIMFAVNIYSIGEYIASEGYKELYQSDSSCPVRFAADIAAAWLDLGEMLVGAGAAWKSFVNAFKKAENLADIGAKFGKFLGLLSVISGGVDIVRGISGIGENFEEGILNIISGTSQLLFGISSFAFASGQLWIVVVAGVLVAAMEIYNVIKEHFDPKPKQVMHMWWDMFMNYKKKIETYQGNGYMLNYVERYKNRSYGLKRFIERIENSAENDFNIEWKRLSWKAIIPLYSQGFPRETIAKLFIGWDLPGRGYTTDKIIDYYEDLLDAGDELNDVVIRGEVLYDGESKSWVEPGHLTRFQRRQIFRHHEVKSQRKYNELIDIIKRAMKDQTPIDQVQQSLDSSFEMSDLFLTNQQKADHLAIGEMTIPFMEEDYEEQFMKHYPHYH